MKKLIILIAMIAGAWHWNLIELPSSSSANAFDEMGAPLVLLYTTNNCGRPCQLARDELKRRRVSFEELDINPADENNENVKMWEKLGKNQFPLILSGKEVINGSGTRAQIATFLGLSFDDKYLTKTEKRYFKKHFYADGSPKIVMYGVDWCPSCKSLRGEFKENNIDYIEVDVEKSSEMEKILNTMEIGGYPATWVGYTRVNGTKLKAVNSILHNY